MRQMIFLLMAECFVVGVGIGAVLALVFQE